MLGLRYPKLFVGRTQRVTVTGVRADFCEFCVAVTRHLVLSREQATTFFFYPLEYAEADRESCCEICRSTFRMSLDTDFLALQKTRLSPALNAAEISVPELIKRNHPDLPDRATREYRAMIERAGGTDFIRRQRIVNFLESNNHEVHRRMRRFYPPAAIGTIQALILGFALSLWVPIGLALGFAGSLYALVILTCYIWQRNNVFDQFRNRIERLMALLDVGPDEMLNELEGWSKRFPRAVALFQSHLLRRRQSDDFEFRKGADFIPFPDESQLLPL